VLTTAFPTMRSPGSRALVRLLLPVLVLAVCLAPSVVDAGDSGEVVWQETRAKDGTVRRAVFEVSDPECAYSVMAQPETMGRLLRHVKKLVVHQAGLRFQDISVHERFFLVGNVESRYHRTLNGSDRLEWKLIAGRQARHDGFWQVERLPDGGYQVTFENLIAAKYSIHQGLLRRIQVRTMRDIVESVTGQCGISPQQAPARDRGKEQLVETAEPGRGAVSKPASAGSVPVKKAGPQSR